MNAWPSMPTTARLLAAKFLKLSYEAKQRSIRLDEREALRSEATA
jgi:hypothetical protein